jgi:hypothetical protein
LANHRTLQMADAAHRPGDLAHLTRRKIGCLANQRTLQMADASGEFFVYTRDKEGKWELAREFSFAPESPFAD